MRFALGLAAAVAVGVTVFSFATGGTTRSQATAGTTSTGLNTRRGAALERVKHGDSERTVSGLLGSNYTAVREHGSLVWVYRSLSIAVTFNNERVVEMTRSPFSLLGTRSRAGQTGLMPCNWPARMIAGCGSLLLR